MKRQIKTGDTVKIISGKAKGQTGQVVKVAPADKLAFVEGIGKRTRHLKPTQHQKGGKKDIHVGIHVSNLSVITSAAKQPRKDTK